MKWLSNLFRKEEPKKPDPKKKTWVASVDGQDYSIENFDVIKVQSVDNDIKPYGWVIEMKWNESGNWQTYFSHKIYNSQSSAMSAMIVIKKSLGSYYDFRITAIYAMDQNFYRNYKINKLLDEGKLQAKKYELKAWKLNEDYSFGKTIVQKNKAVFIQLENGNVILSGTPDMRTKYGSYRNLLYETLIPNNRVYEIELKDEKWLYPHLLKELKNKIKK